MAAAIAVVTAAAPATYHRLGFMPGCSVVRVISPLGSPTTVGAAAFAVSALGVSPIAAEAAWARAAALGQRSAGSLAIAAAGQADATCRT